MHHDFKISGIEASEYQRVFELPGDELHAMGAVRMIVDHKPGYPCRVSLEDAELGDEVILLPFQHHDVRSPYQSSGPVFIRKGVKTANLKINQIPEMLLHRTLSLRAYDSKAMMIDARTIAGTQLAITIQNLLDNPDVGYIHVHNAGPGCYNCRIDRT